MFRPLVHRAASILSFALLAGCGSPAAYMRTAIRQYEVGNYNAASYECQGARDDERYMSAKSHARYLVYCGLANYRIGQRAQAQAMLVRGNEEYLDGRANWLKPGIVDDLYKALDDLEGRPHPRPSREAFRGRRRD